MWGMGFLAVWFGSDERVKKRGKILFVLCTGDGPSGFTHEPC
jgi:hypothetical protein